MFTHCGCQVDLIKTKVSIQWRCHSLPKVTAKTTIFHRTSQHSLPVYMQIPLLCLICVFGNLSYLFIFSRESSVRGTRWPFTVDPPEWPNSSSNQGGKIPDRQYPFRHVGNVYATESNPPVQKDSDNRWMLTCFWPHFSPSPSLSVEKAFKHSPGISLMLQQPEL